jgi:hypothetical protein
MNAREILVKKKYPDGYPDDVIDTLNHMSFTKGKDISLMGSMPLRSQTYAGDYDAVETVEVGGDRKHAVKEIVKKFQDAVRAILSRPKTFIADIKCGSIDEWDIVTEPYDAKKSAENLKKLYDDKIVTTEQYNKERKLLKPASELSRLELLYVRHEIRHNIVRWNAREILNGSKTLVDGRRYTLEEAIQARTMTKMDVVSWVQNNRFTDFSCIYIFKNNGNIINVGLQQNVVQAMRDNMYTLKSTGNYFKMAKRMFAIAKYQNKTKTIERLSPLFTGDLGRLYHVYGDIGTLESLFEMKDDLPYSEIKLEVDQFKGRLSNIVLNGYLKAEDTILNDIEKAESRKSMQDALEKLKDKLYTILQNNTKRYLMKKGIMRPHSAKTRRANAKVLKTTLKNLNFGIYY